MLYSELYYLESAFFLFLLLQWAIWLKCRLWVNIYYSKYFFKRLQSKLDPDNLLWEKKERKISNFHRLQEHSWWNCGFQSQEAFAWVLMQAFLVKSVRLVSQGKANAEVSWGRAKNPTNQTRKLTKKPHVVINVMCYGALRLCGQEIE